MQFWQSYSAIT